MDYVNDTLDRGSEFFSTLQDDSWKWFNGLNREEWMLVLAIAAIAGFVCLMLGMGNRK